MSATKRYLEKVSILKGYDGEINQEVMQIAEELSRKMTTPAAGDAVVVFNVGNGRGVLKERMSENLWRVDIEGKDVFLGIRDFSLQKALDFHRELENVQ